MKRCAHDILSVFETKSMLLIAIYRRRVTVYQAVRELLTAIVGGLLSLGNTLYPDNSFVTVSKAEGIHVSFPLLPMSVFLRLLVPGLKAG